MRKVRKLFMSGKRQQGVGGFNPAAAFDAPSSGKRRRRRRKVSRTKYRETVKSGALSLVKFIPYLLIATAAASLPLAGYKLYVYFLSSPYFALRQIEVQGVERLSSDLIVRATGLSAGANVLAIDEDGAREKLEALAWIRRADVSRELPDRVVITVVERHPAAILVEENSWLVDTEGNPFKELAQSDYDPSLLVLAGVEVSRLHRAGRGERAREMLGEALAIAKDYRAMGLDRRCSIAGVDYDDIVGYTLVSSEQQRFVLGFGNFPEKLHRLSVVLEDLSRRDSGVEVVRLDNEKQPWKVAAAGTSVEFSAGPVPLSMPALGRELLP